MDSFIITKQYRQKRDGVLCFEGREKNTDVNVFIKKIYKNVFKDDDDINRVTQIINSMKLLPKETFIELIQFFEGKKSYILIYELCDDNLETTESIKGKNFNKFIKFLSKKNLNKFLKGNNKPSTLITKKLFSDFIEKEYYNYIQTLPKEKMTLDNIQSIMRDLNKSFDFLFKNGVTHGNITLSSILVNYLEDSEDDNSGSSTISLKVDYDVITKYYKDDNDAFDKSIVYYKAPELFEDPNDYSFKSDLWSIGIIMYVLYFGDFPFKGETKEEVLEQINEGVLQKSGDYYFDDLIEKLLKKDKEERINYNDYFEHDFFEEEVTVKSTFSSNLWSHIKPLINTFLEIFIIILIISILLKKNIFNIKNFFVKFNKVSENDVIEEGSYDDKYTKYYEFENGIFEGRLVGGLRTGYGKFIYNKDDNRSEYKGNWKNNLPNGEGKLTWKNGNRYEGYFVDDMLDGHGIIYYSSGIIFDGQFANNKKNGPGTHYSDGRGKLEGTWIDDRLEGKTTTYYPNGCKLIASYYNGKINGVGHFYYPNGIVEVGLYKNNEIQKILNRTFPNGTTFIFVDKTEE